MLLVLLYVTALGQSPCFYVTAPGQGLHLSFNCNIFAGTLVQALPY